MRKEKTCGDCLHCKMTVLTVGNNNLCFCEKKLPRDYKPEPYWLKKNTCKNFNDMGVYKKIVPRRPLLKLPSIGRRVYA